jgi:hypothetical protein
MALRQVVHGQKIAQSIMQDASGLTQILYGVVSLALKNLLTLLILIVHCLREMLCLVVALLFE